jgi:hypothetical protein
MKFCVRCDTDKKDEDFYSKDSTCKECRKALVRKNRSENSEYYREYDKLRFKHDPKVRARHLKYQKTYSGKRSMEKSRHKWQSQNPAKRAAHVILCNYVRDGRIIKPTCCEYCGQCKGRIHGHHNDYAYPLSVQWLCPKCHTEWHQANGEGANA